MLCCIFDRDGEWHIQQAKHSGSRIHYPFYLIAKWLVWINPFTDNSRKLRWTIKGRQNTTHHYSSWVKSQQKKGERRRVVLLVANSPHTDASLCGSGESERFNKTVNPLKAAWQTYSIDREEGGHVQHRGDNQSTGINTVSACVSAGRNCKSTRLRWMSLSRCCIDIFTSYISPPPQKRWHAV